MERNWNDERAGLAAQGIQLPAVEHGRVGSAQEGEAGAEAARESVSRKALS